MLDNSQKTPIARSLNEFAQNKVRDAMSLLGKAIPASVTAAAGSIVTVKFELNAPFPLPAVTMPLAGSEYIRLPIQAGDKGLVIPSDYYLGGVSGLGGGTAGVTLPANLSALVFVPIGSKNWDASESANKIVLYGPDGAILRNKNKTSSFEANNTAAVMTFGNYNLTLDATGFHINAPIAGVVAGVGGTVDLGTNNLTTTGNITSQGATLKGHHHTVSGGNTGPALP